MRRMSLPVEALSGIGPKKKPRGGRWYLTSRVWRSCAGGMIAAASLVAMASWHLRVWNAPSVVKLAIS